MQINLEDEQKAPKSPWRIPIPGLPHEVGLGQAIAKATQAVGVKPCGGCKKRAEAMDKQVVFSPWRT